MSDSLKVDDPHLAVVLERIDGLKTAFSEHKSAVKEEFDQLRKERADEFEKVRKEQVELAKKIEPFANAVTKAQGGWLVLLGLGSLLAWSLGLYDKALKLFH